MVVKPYIYTLLISSTLAMHSHVSNASGEYDPINDKKIAIQKGTDILTQDYIDSLINHSQEVQQKALASYEPSNKPVGLPSVRHYKILISESMGDTALNALLKEYQHRNDVSFVIRGLLPTERTFNDAAQRIMRLMQGFKQVPNISLDPRPFSYMNTETVPHLLAYDGDHVIASVSGLTNIPWVNQQLADGNQGDLGSYGNQVKISERHIEDILKERVEACLKMVEMSHRADHKPNQLSGGQKQRLAIARGLYKQGDVLLFDDVFSALDLQTEQLIVQSLLGKKGKTIIISTHRMAIIDYMDKILLLNNGELTAFDTPDIIKQHFADELHEILNTHEVDLV